MKTQTPEHDNMFILARSPEEITMEWREPGFVWQLPGTARKCVAAAILRESTVPARAGMSHMLRAHEEQSERVLFPEARTDTP